jgi:hypothetical protein
MGRMKNNEWAKDELVAMYTIKGVAKAKYYYCGVEHSVDEAEELIEGGASLDVYLCDSAKKLAAIPSVI